MPVCKYCFHISLIFSLICNMDNRHKSLILMFHLQYFKGPLLYKIYFFVFQLQLHPFKKKKCVIKYRCDIKPFMMSQGALSLHDTPSQVVSLFSEAKKIIKNIKLIQEHTTQGIITGLDHTYVSFPHNNLQFGFFFMNFIKLLNFLNGTDKVL